MSKRFTDTEKWTKNKWFRKLPSKYKLLWLYTLDMCDQIGVWEEDIEFASILIGVDLDLNEFIDFMDGRIIKISETKYLIVDFVSFQYGSLSEKSRPHESFIKMIEKAGLQEYFSDIIINESKTIKAKRSRITNKKKQDIYLRDKFTCQYCGEHIDNPVCDHVIPLVKGGTNDDDNLKTCCIECNSRKSDLTIQEFYNKNNSVYKNLDRVSKIIYSLKDKDKDKDKGKGKGKEEGIVKGGEPENIYREFKHLSITKDEVDKLCDDLNVSITDVDAILDDVENCATNKKYTSLYLTARKWLSRNIKENKPLVNGFDNEYGIDPATLITPMQDARQRGKVLV